ncbi:aspartic peptidase domain-containing protein [Amylostereum chailletii]|nr:aspartic peptidase domain-containing protein [Amylostereum chailletii]
MYMASLSLLLAMLLLFGLSNRMPKMVFGQSIRFPSQLHIPLLQYPIGPGRVQNARMNMKRQVEDTRYGSDSKTFRRAHGYNLLVNHRIDTNYYGSIFVGTPPVAYNIFLDTGSADLWLAGSTCSKCDEGISKFNTLSSTTFEGLSGDFNINYGSGEVSGTFGRDTVQLAGMEVGNQVFGVVNSISDDILDPSVSGLIGLAWRSLSPSNTEPLWQTLFASGVLDEPLMAFQLTNFRGYSEPSPLLPGGTFSLGAVNETLYTGQIDYQDMPPVDDRKHWILPLSGITVNGIAVSLPTGEDSYAVIDTGTTLVSGPEEQIAELYAQIPGAELNSGGDYDGFYSYPCSLAPTVNVTLSFGTGPGWPITPTNFIFSQPETGTCIGAFVPSSQNIAFGAPWIVGIAFLNNVYSVFRADPPSIGFAALSTRAKDFGKSAVLPTPTIASVSVNVTGSGSVGSGSSVYGRRELGNTGWTWVPCIGWSMLLHL